MRLVENSLSKRWLKHQNNEQYNLEINIYCSKKQGELILKKILEEIEKED